MLTELISNKKFCPFEIWNFLQMETISMNFNLTLDAYDVDSGTIIVQ